MFPPRNTYKKKSAFTETHSPPSTLPRRRRLSSNKKKRGCILMCNRIMLFEDSLQELEQGEGILGIKIF